MSNIDKIERFFDRVAPQYDGILADNGWPANDMLRDRLVGGEMSIGNALDLGTPICNRWRCPDIG